MKIRYAIVLGVLVLAAVLLVRPAVSNAATEPIAAVSTQAAQAPAAADNSAQALVQACTDAHNLPTPEQRNQAMNKLMNDPNLVGQMNKMMNDPKLAGQMGSMMNGSFGSMMSNWRTGTTPAANAPAGSNSANNAGSTGCH